MPFSAVRSPVPPALSMQCPGCARLRKEAGPDRAPRQGHASVRIRFCPYRRKVRTRPLLTQVDPLHIDVLDFLLSKFVVAGTLHLCRACKTLQKDPRQARLRQCAGTVQTALHAGHALQVLDVQLAVLEILECAQALLQAIAVQRFGRHIVELLCIVLDRRADALSLRETAAVG